MTPAVEPGGDAEPVEPEPGTEPGRLLGRVVRLQVQLRPLKPGTAPWRRYRPEAITAVDALAVGPDGAYGITADGDRLLDVHHRDHPQSRDPKGRSGLTVMVRGDYAALRDRYGQHVVDGVAGESLLLDRETPITGGDLSAGLVAETVDGHRLALDRVRPAAPCVEFARFCLRQDPSAHVDSAVRQGLLDLDGGTRGYRAVAASTGTIAVGARVWLRGTTSPVA